MIREQEREKYADVWQIPQYHDFSHGEFHSEMFMEITGATPGESVIDFGCGTGKGGKALKKRGLKPTYLDLVRVGNLRPFREQSLWQPIHGLWDYGLCCDVLEHLPCEFTMLAVSNMLKAVGGLFLSICFEDESFSEMVGKPLHLTVRPFTWWRDNLREIGELVEARDLSPPLQKRDLQVGIFYLR